MKIAAGLTIAAGTYAGGWRIIRTLGQRIYKMQPEHGFAAQLSAGTTLYVGTQLGFPISTTHVVTGSVMGAGATRRLSAVRWGVAGNIVFAWLLTLPAAALVAAALYYPWPGSSRAFPERSFTIVQLSDLHCGQQFFLPQHLERAIAEVNELQPDVVVISGDLTSTASRTSTRSRASTSTGSSASRWS